MAIKGNRDVWVFAEQRHGELHDVSLELIGKAQPFFLVTQ
jgi:electron transfer flavoprotein alpha subunit